MKGIWTIVGLFFTNFIFAQTGIYYVGHSLVNKSTPFMVKELRVAAGYSIQYRHHINNGASLQWQWTNPTSFNIDPIWDPALGMNVEHGTNFLTALAPGASPSFQRMIITESVPLLNNHVDTTGKYGKYFHDLAKNHDASIKNYMMSTWEYVGTGSNAWADWRNQITTYKPYWEARVDKINTPSTSNNMYIVPAGMALGALYDTLQNHAIGSLSNISSLFSDNIHLNDDGNYFVSCVMYATLFLQSPEGLPAVKPGPYVNYTVIDESAVRNKLQEIAWKVVQSYPRTGYVPPLAVNDLECFNVNKSEDFVKVNFCLAKTAKPQDIIIEKSYDGVEFESIGMFKSIYSGNYSLIDRELKLGVNYYRLKFVDSINKNLLEYSKIKSIVIEDLNSEILYPNPVDDILYYNGNITQSSVKFYNTIGSFIMELPLQNSMNIENLNKGIYFVQLPNNKVFRILKE